MSRIFSDFIVDLDDAEIPDISKEGLASENDIARLTGWYSTLDAKAMEMAEFVAAYRIAEIDDEDYFRRTAGALAYVRIAIRWVERRILELGETPPYSPLDPRSRQLRILNEKIEKMAKRLNQLEQEPASC